MDNPNSLPAAAHKISAVDTLSEGIVVLFEDGKEHVFPADLLYAFVPQEFDLAEQLKAPLRAQKPE